MLGGGVQSDTSLAIQGIQFGVTSPAFNPVSTSGFQLTINGNSANPIVDRSINYTESVSGLNTSAIIVGVDGVYYDANGIPGATPTVTADLFGNDNAAREGWNTPVVNVQTRSGIPATGYYDLR